MRDNPGQLEHQYSRDSWQSWVDDARENLGPWGENIDSLMFRRALQ
jgi:hypothetical protein